MSVANSAHVETLIRDTRRTLENIDFEYTLEIEKLERSNADRMLKRGIAQKLRERHQQRREPYVRLMRELAMRREGVPAVLDATG